MSDIDKALEWVDAHKDSGFRTLAGFGSTRVLAAEVIRLRQALKHYSSMEGAGRVARDALFGPPSKPCGEAAARAAAAKAATCKCGHKKYDHWMTGPRLSCRPDGDARKCPCDSFQPCGEGAGA